MTVAFPLQWPAGWPRTPASKRKRAQFATRGRGHHDRLTVADARRRLSDELDAIRASYVTLSSNCEMRLDGQPRSGAKEPDDVGAAVYFVLQGRQMCLACDRWDSVADNIAAIAKHIEAMRGMDRWGVGTAAQAFAGYEYLPPPKTWRDILGDPRSRDDAEAAFQRLAKMHHPDAGGSTATMAELNEAIAAARKELG